MPPAVFLDRDDTLIAANALPAPSPPAAPGDLIDPQLVRLLPGVAEGLARLKRAGFALVVISNQGVVSRGGGTLSQIEAVSARLRELLPDPDRPGRSLIDAAYTCPFHPRGQGGRFTREHEWRKPSCGMIRAAADELGLDLSASWLIGDAARDVAAGVSAGLGPARCIQVSDHKPFDAAVNDVLGARRAGCDTRNSTAPLRLLVVVPSWVGDAVMATPALRLIRASFPGAFIGALVRPGIDQVLAGSNFFDEVHVERASGVMGPKHAAAKVRPRRYNTALLLTNSFSTALITRLAGIDRRIGFARDARSLLLTERLRAPTRPDGRWAPVSAVAYYWHAARALLRLAGKADPGPTDPFGLPPARMELATTPEQDAEAAAILTRAGIAPNTPTAILNPGGNNAAKRWPPDRFAEIGRLLAGRGMTLLINGSPAEADLARSITDLINATNPDAAINLATLGISLGSLKGIVRRARIMVTNDTGPRHIAAAFGVPVVSLFGPTDPRWTTIPVGPDDEAVLVADPTLSPEEVADDHPERCRVDRITVEAVAAAVERLLLAASKRFSAPG